VPRPTRHGGDHGAIRRELNLAHGPLLDVSTVLNPLGPRPEAIEAARSALSRVDRHPELGSPALVEALSRRHGIPAANLLVGAGTTALIGLIGQCLREVLALHASVIGNPLMPVVHLVEPTRGAYRRAAERSAMKAEVWSKHALGWRQDFVPRSAAGLYWTGHPNNPTGRTWDRDALLRLVDDTESLLIVVDESELPYLADEADRTLVGEVAGRENLLVLRSLSSVYGTPGLRVGYAVASADMVQRVSQFRDPWSVDPVAEAAALAAIDDDAEYLSRTRALVRSESDRLLSRLWDIPGLRPCWPSRDRPPTAPPLPASVLVSLVDTPHDSIGVHAAMARRGVVVRECSDFPGLEVGALLTGPDQLVATRGQLRIGVRRPEENARVLELLEAVVTGPVG